MTSAKIILLFLMLFSLPIILYFSNEHLLGQLLFFNQLVVIWGLLPFIFRQEHMAPKEWSRRSLLFTFPIAIATIIPFLIHLADKSAFRSTDIAQSSVSLFSDLGEIFLVLGICLATIFVIAGLVKRRGQEV